MKLNIYNYDDQTIYLVYQQQLPPHSPIAAETKTQEHPCAQGSTIEQ